MKITEKAAYLKGLADGLEIDNTTKEAEAYLRQRKAKREQKKKKKK